MRIPFTNRRMFERSAPRIEPSDFSRDLRGSALRSVVIRPDEAQNIRTMTAVSDMVRGMQEHNDKMFRSYDAAMTNNFNQDFKGTYGTANTEIFTYYYRIWARVRTLAKDTPHGKAIVRTYQTNLVGHDPFSLTMRLGKTVKAPHPVTGATVKLFQAEDETNTMIEGKWKQFCRAKNFTIRGTINFMEAMNQVVAEAITIGSGMIRLWRGFANNDFGFAVDILESDRLQPSYNGKAPDTGNPIRASIEYHPTWNYPLAYWVLTRHPGEFYSDRNFPGPSATKVLRERVPASDIIHYNNLRNRAEQDLGFSELEACVNKIYENFKYAGALTQASIASACKPWVIEKDTPTGMTYAGSAADFDRSLSEISSLGDESLARQGLGGNAVKMQQEVGTPREIISPGMTKVLEWGFKMKVLDPKFPIEAAHEFRVDNNKEIATAAGVSYSDMTGDFQSLGYIAAQMSQRPSRDFAMMHQANIIDVVVLRIFEEWMKSSILYDVFDFPLARMDEFVEGARFRGKRFPFTDELREVQALVLKLDAKLITPQQAQDLMPDGIDIADVVAQWSEWLEMCEAYDVPTMDAPTAVTEKEVQNEPGAAGEPPTAGGGADDPPPTTKPAKAKGSVTAKMQKSRRRRAVISPQVLALLGDARNGH